MKFLTNYTIVENGKVFVSYFDKLPDSIEKGLIRLIETYEQIRNLENFDLGHCPLMEFQTCNEKDYFLQYHITRNFSPVKFVLERDLKKGELEVDFVRGASTTPEGFDTKMLVVCSDNWNCKKILNGRSL